jgi:hypothetical protein
MPECLKTRRVIPGRLPALLLSTLLALVLPHANAQTASPARFDLASGREPMVSLNGLWRFHPGDNPAWADPAFDDSAWPLLRSDQPWSQQGYPAMSGFAWYRFTVQIPAGSGPVSLLLAPIETSYEVYLDGRLAGTGGKMPPTFAPFAMFEFHQFPLGGESETTGDASGRTWHVAIRVWHSKIWAGYLGGGPDRPGSVAGATSLISVEYLHRKNAQKFIFVDSYSYSIVAALVGLTIFGLFCFRPREREYLWFAALLLSAAVDAALGIIYNVYSVLPVPIFDLLDGAMIAVNQAAALAFFSIVLHARRGRVWTICLILALISPFLNVLYWPGWLSVPASAALSLLCVLPSSVWVLAILLRRAIRRDPDARLLMLPSVLYYGYFFLYNLAILLSQAGWITLPDALQEPIPLPPFTMHWQILVNLIFLAALLAFLIRRFTIARQGEERYAGQMEAARQVQQVLLPEAIAQVPGFAVECVYFPAELVGGDFFQILPAGSGGLLIVIGDVAGKGLPAAMMVSVLVGAIRTEAAHNTDPATLLSSLNERMVGRSEGRFTTCLCAHISPDGKLEMANAGHLAPYRNGLELPLTGALPLGMLGNLSYDPDALQLNPGDRLTFVSDGVVEAQGKSGELFGFDRTQRLSSKSALEIAETARQFGQTDDVTVVTIEFLGDPAAIPVNLALEAAPIQ